MMSESQHSDDTHKSESPFEFLNGKIDTVSVNEERENSITPVPTPTELAHQHSSSSSISSGMTQVAGSEARDSAHVSAAAALTPAPPSPQTMAQVSSTPAAKPPAAAVPTVIFTGATPEGGAITATHPSQMYTPSTEAYATPSQIHGASPQTASPLVSVAGPQIGQVTGQAPAMAPPTMPPPQLPKFTSASPTTSHQAAGQQQQSNPYSARTYTTPTATRPHTRLPGVGSGRSPYVPCSSGPGTPMPGKLPTTPLATIPNVTSIPTGASPAPVPGATPTPYISPMMMAPAQSVVSAQPHMSYSTGNTPSGMPPIPESPVTLPLDFSGHSETEGSGGNGSGGPVSKVFGWMNPGGIVNKVMEKARNSVDSMITTLDPQMKEYIRSGGDIDIVVASMNVVKVTAVREAFQSVFGRATVNCLEAHGNIAPQPVGFTAGLKGAEERINTLRRSGQIDDTQAVIAIESCITDLTPDRWYDVGCIVFQDRKNGIDLQMFTQATPVPTEYVMKVQQQTPEDYNLRWSGLAATIGNVIQQSLPHVHHSNWHQHLTGVSRQEMIFLASRTLAGMYRQRLPIQQPAPSHNQSL